MGDGIGRVDVPRVILTSCEVGVLGSFLRQFFMEALDGGTSSDVSGRPAAEGRSAKGQTGGQAGEEGRAKGKRDGRPRDGGEPAARLRSTVEHRLVGIGSTRPEARDPGVHQPGVQRRQLLVFSARFVGLPGLLMAHSHQIDNVRILRSAAGRNNLLVLTRIERLAQVADRPQSAAVLYQRECFDVVAHACIWNVFDDMPFG